MSALIVKTQHLNKAFGRHNQAVQDLEINVPEGVVYGLLGRNGAGKTTTLRMLMALLKPTSGQVQVLGHDPWKMPVEVRQQMGYASDSMQLIPWLKVSELLNYNGAFYPQWDPAYAEQWVNRLHLPLNKRIFHLSRGDRQKLGLLTAIGHRPKLLILDEPAGGFDPVARKEFLESIIELIHEAGTTIILSSHAMGDLERIADWIGLIDQGRVQVEMPLETLKATTRRVKIVGGSIIEPKLEGVIQRKSSPHALTLVVRDWSPSKEDALRQQYPEATLEIEALNLEDIFLAYTTGGH